MDAERQEAAVQVEVEAAVAQLISREFLSAIADLDNFDNVACSEVGTYVQPLCELVGDAESRDHSGIDDYGGVVTWVEPPCECIPILARAPPRDL